MPVSPAREIAFEILRRVEAEGAYASDLLYAELSPSVRREDAGLATELTLGVLRWRRLLDFLLEKHVHTRLAQLELEILLALRLGLYQLRFLERVPARAAVSEAVELVKAARKRSAAALVNAALRHAAEYAREPAGKFLSADIPPAERLGILRSHPTWLVERWFRQFGEEQTTSLLDANNRPAPSACIIHVPEERGAIEESLRSAGMCTQSGRLLTSALTVSGGSPTQTEAFRSGKISVQDEASQLIPMLLGVKEGDRVLDLCAAPGGKTAVLARCAGPSGHAIAADHHAHRLRALAAQMKRLHLSNISIVELDAERALPFHKFFSKILVDAPCSGTGTLARHPEIRWRLRVEDFPELHRRQVSILESALSVMGPGGRLVYATCSLEPEENEAVVAEALSQFPGVTRVPASRMMREIASLLAAGLEPKSLVDSEGALRTFPPEHSADGFFAVAFERRTT